MKLKSIKTQILCLLLVVSFGSLLFGFFINYFQLTQALREKEMNRIRNAARTVKHLLEDKAHDLQLMAGGIVISKEVAAGLIVCKKTGDFTFCQEMLNRLVPYYRGRRTAIANQTGQILDRPDGKVSEDAYQDISAMEKALQGETVFAAGPGPDGWEMRILIPIVSDDTVVSVLILARILDKPLFEQLARTVGMEIGLFSLDGLGVNSIPATIQKHIGNDLIKNTLLGRSEGIIDHTKDTSLILYTPIKLADQTFCLVIVHEAHKAIHSQLINQRNSLIAFSLLLSTVIVIGGFFFTRHLTKPLLNLRQKTEGVINALIPLPHSVIFTGNEIKAADQTFDLLQQALHEHLVARKEAEDKLAQIYQQMQIQMEELQESKQYLMTIFSSMEDGVFILEVDGTIRSINQKSHFHLGCPEEKVAGVPFGNFVDDKDWKDRCHNGKNIETRLRCADGGFLDILLSGAVISDQNGVQTGFVCVVKDITDLKNAHEREKKQEIQMAHSGRLAALGEMSTGIAHEINQPLTIIRLASQYLQQKIGKEKDEQVNTSLQKIIEQIDRVTQIVTNMRAFARGNNDQGISPTNCAEAIDKALFFFREQFRGRSIHLVETIDHNLPDGLVNGQHLQQIMVNLLSNSRDAVEQQAESKGADYQMVIEVSLSRGSCQQAVIEVRDNGIGMTAEVKENCLNAFFTTKEEGKGTGLGLSIVSNLAQTSQMTLHLESEPDNGCSCQLIYRLMEKAAGERQTS